MNVLRMRSTSCEFRNKQNQFTNSLSIKAEPTVSQSSPVYVVDWQLLADVGGTQISRQLDFECFTAQMMLFDEKRFHLETFTIGGPNVEVFVRRIRVVVERFHF